MAFYSGKDGELWIDGVKAARVRGWSVSSSVATLDTTSLEQTDRTVISGIRSTNGNCSLFYYETDPGSSGDCGTLLRKVMQAATTSDTGIAPVPQNVRLKLKVNDGTTNGHYIEGDCVITSASMTMAVGEVLAAEVAFEFNGAPTSVVL